MTHALHLADFPERSLDLLASLLAGRPLRVVVTPRLERPAVLALEAASVYLDPRVCGLYDLVLLARLAGHADLAAGVDSTQRRRLLRAVRGVEAELRTRLPGALALPGFHHPRHDLADLPLVTRRQVPLRPLGAEGPPPGGHFELACGVELAGVEGDLRAYLDAVAAGRVPLTDRAELPGVSVGRLTLRLREALVLPDDWERFEATLEAAREGARDIGRCMLRRAQDQDHTADWGRLRHHGALLDPARLHDARLASRLGRPLPVFRRPRHAADATWRPEEHVGVVSFDANAARATPLGRKNVCAHVVPMLALALQRLGMPFAIEGHADRLLTLPDGRRAYLAVRVPVKGFDEPLGTSVWNRLLTSFRLGRVDAGAPAAAHALQVDALATSLEREARRRGARSALGCYVGPRAPVPPLDAEGLRARAVESMEARLADLGRVLRGGATLTFVLPEILRAHAPSRGAVKDALFV